ncbi:MAG: zf-HC2 domain-containing protein, partial [Planctomycetota bacterium]
MTLPCAEAREALSARLDGELSPAEESTLLDHLAQCSPCRQHARRLERTVAALRSARGRSLLP